MYTIRRINYRLDVFFSSFFGIHVRESMVLNVASYIEGPLCDMIFAYLNSSMAVGAIRKVRDGAIVSRLFDGHIWLFTLCITV